MKKLLFISVIATFLFSCKNNQEKKGSYENVNSWTELSKDYVMVKILKINHEIQPDPLNIDALGDSLRSGYWYMYVRKSGCFIKLSEENYGFFQAGMEPEQISRIIGYQGIYGVKIKYDTLDRELFLKEAYNPEGRFNLKVVVLCTSGHFEHGLTLGGGQTIHFSKYAENK